MNRLNTWSWLVIAVLLVLHHDFWFWDSDYLVAGVIPIGLAYHICYSIVVTITWIVLIRLYWPQDLAQEQT